MDLIDFYRTVHPNMTEYTFFLAAHGALSKMLRGGVAQGLPLIPALGCQVDLCGLEASLVYIAS